MAATMKAVVYTQYGTPDVLRVKTIEKPTPKDNEVLIKVRATTVTSVDSTFRRGSSFSAKLYTGFLKPKNPILGEQLAGEIEAVGKDVTLFKKGDQIYGGTGGGFGAHTEYVCLPEDGALALKPTNMNYEEAAAISEALTALPFLRDSGNIQPGDHVLINGASGAIGSIAVQLAKYYGATVTGVCSTANVEMVKALGADAVIDYTKDDFTKNSETYDIIFDSVGKSSFSRSKNALKQQGVYMTTVITLGILSQMLWTARVGHKKAIFSATGMRTASQKAEDLRFLKTLIEAGHLKSAIDRRYPLEKIAEAHNYVDSGHKKGNVVITI